MTTLLDGEPVGQLDPDELRGHAGHVLGIIAAAKLDTELHRILTTSIGIDSARADAVIGTLPEHWPSTPRSSS